MQVLSDQAKGTQKCYKSKEKNNGRFFLSTKCHMKPRQNTEHQERLLHGTNELSEKPSLGPKHRAEFA